MLLSWFCPVLAALRSPALWIVQKAIRIRGTLNMESGLITSRRVSFALMVCLIFGSIPTVLAEEETPTASRIVGTVVQSGQPVQGATVVARDLSSGVVSRSLPTNAAGKYVIHVKGLGYHDMAIETGNMVFPATRVLNVIGEETTANFQLLPSVNSKGEPRTFEGSEGETGGSADLIEEKERRRGGAPLMGGKSKKILGGVAAIVGGVAVGQLLSSDSSSSPTN